MTAAILACAASFAGAPREFLNQVQDDSLRSHAEPLPSHANPLTSHAEPLPSHAELGSESAHDGRLLTMEETILSRELSPQWKRYEWAAEGKGYTVREVKGRSHVKAPCLKAVNIDNGLYIEGLEAKPVAVAVDSNPYIVYGQAVSRNEFGITGGVFWSPDSLKLAFYRKDESAVGSFPLLDINSRTGSLKSIKYPMAGMASEKLRLCVYDLASRDTVHLKVSDFGADRYLTNVCWSPDASHIFIQVLDRSQKHLRLNMYDAASGEFVKTILTEDNEKYVEPLDPLYWVKGSDTRFIYRTANRDGYRNLYLCDIEGNISRLTKTDADIEYVDNDGRCVYYYSAEVSPAERHFFKIDMRSGKKTRLSMERGRHTVSLSPDYRRFVDEYSSLCNPGTTMLCSTDGRKRELLSQNADPTLGYAYSEIRLGSVKSADSLYDNHYRMIMPKDFDPSKKYPLILYAYGGPHSQMVTDSWLANLRRWEMYMAQRGYIVYVQDNRGTQNHGLAYEQAVHGRCGQAEMADQMEGMKMLMNLPYVDTERIGVHGWSYGGFMTISLITNYPDIFKVAVAGGPVIDWKWYEVMYGERYMDHPSVNAEGYEAVSLLGKAKDLKGKLLICQGAVDPVVVWQHSLSFVQECIKNNVQVDYFPYPCAEHNMVGKERVHLMNKVTEYFDLFL